MQQQRHFIATLLGYAIEGSSCLQRDQPFLLAFDFNTAAIILVLVCFAAVFSAALATQPVIAQKAIKILRNQSAAIDPQARERTHPIDAIRVRRQFLPPAQRVDDLRWLGYIQHRLGDDSTAVKTYE